MRLGWVLVVVAVAAEGCASEPYGPYLKWEARPPAAQQAGRVAIKSVVNRRSMTEPNNVGNWRAGFGIPYPIRVDSGHTGAQIGGVTFEPRPLDETLRALVSDGLQAAGLGLAAPNDPNATAQLVIEIQEFWVDGDFNDVYKAMVALNLVLLDPATGATRASATYRGQGTGDPGQDGKFAGEGTFAQRAFKRALDRALAEISSGLAQPPMRLAALGSGPAPAVMAPAAPPGSLRACVPGQSIACVGAGGCQGFQVCADDGSRFQSCSCKN
jgi:hypothetical protein